MGIIVNIRDDWSVVPSAGYIRVSNRIWNIVSIDIFEMYFFYDKGDDSKVNINFIRLY